MGRTATKVGSGGKRDAASESAEQRLSVLELARESGNVAEACCQRGSDRTSFYQWKRRSRLGSPEGGGVPPWGVQGRLRRTSSSDRSFGSGGTDSLDQTQGFAGLKELAPIHKSHPQTTPAETVARIEELVLEHPAYGCNRLEPLLSWEGQRVSAVTIQTRRVGP